MLDIYIYVFGSQSCATRLVFEGSAPLLGHRLRRLRFASGDTGCGPDRDRAWHLWSSSSREESPRLRSALGLRPRLSPRYARPSLRSAATPLHAPPLPSSSRRYAPQCFVGEYTSSPCDVSHRASDEPRRRMSLSSALAPMSLASPSIRRVFLRSICARRRSVSSLNLAATHPHPA